MSAKSSRRIRNTRKRRGGKTHRRRKMRTEGGMCKRRTKSRNCVGGKRKRRSGGNLTGSPVRDALASSWPSQASLGQGIDYAAQHIGQHGGEVALYPQSVLSSGLPMQMQGPAGVASTFRSLQEISGMSDQPQIQKGGRRNRKGKGRTRNYRRGGNCGGEYARANAQGMLLSANEYSKAGLNPGYSGSSLEYGMAAARNTA